MRLKSMESHQHQRASVLILVLIVISSMTILSVGLAYRTRVEVKLSGADAQRTKAYYLALGGIERARALLSRQKSPLVVPKLLFVAGFVMPRNGCQCYWNQLGTIDYWMDICGKNFLRYNFRIYSDL